MFKMNFSGTRLMKVTSSKFDKVKLTVNCRIIGDIKIFDAHGILKEKISGTKLARHIKKKFLDNLKISNELDFRNH